MEKKYIYGTEMVKCECGVWRVDIIGLPCWNHEDRKQAMVEAFAMFDEAQREFGRAIKKAVLAIRRAKS